MTLPEDESLPEYLRGNGAKCRFIFQLVNDGKLLKTNQETTDLASGNKRTHNKSPHRAVRIDPSWKTTNIARLECVDANSKTSNPQHFPDMKRARGYRLEGDTGRLTVEVSMHFFGGNSDTSTLEINW